MELKSEEGYSAAVAARIPNLKVIQRAFSFSG
jgi:hypothetical protein